MTLRRLGERCLRALGSLALSCVLLILLGILTWLGTLAQADSGLHAVQKKYFESYFLLQPVGPVALPLPGANLVLTVLFVNLAVGGILRLRKGRSTAGVLVAHLGIALLLVAGFVKLSFSQEGHVTLFEGQEADSFQSYHRWEVAVIEDLGGGRVREHLVPQEDFRDATGSEPVTLRSEEIPFDLEIRFFLENCRPLPKGPMFDVDVPVVDGVFLQERPPGKDSETDVAGAYATAVHEGGRRSEGILWGLDIHPLPVHTPSAAAPPGSESGRARWAVELRRERYPMPFTIELEEFTKEDHPGIAMPKAFSSDVRVHDHTGSEGGRPVRISMNEPLREAGLVLYQASWGPSNARPGDRLFSTLAVARNPADRLPLAACIVIAAGLLWHFARKLVRYVRAEAAA